MGQPLRPGLQRPILKNDVNFPVCMAPMVGLSHVAFRRVCRGFLPAGANTIWPTEMLNSRRLPSENLKRTAETLRDDSESHLVPQILGNEEKFIAPSVARLEEWGARGIDINMGCPVKKALSHNYGVALMGDAKYAAEVVRITVRSSRLPVSVKLRAVSATEELLDFVRGLEDAGASWITLHPRTAEQKRRGVADWSQIQELRSRISIPVIGNGDVQSAEDALELFAATGCDMVMVGRALTARPWLLWQIGEKLGWPNPPGKTGPAPRTPEEEGAAYGECLTLLVSYLREHLCADAGFSESLGLRKLAFYVRTSSPWLHFGHELYSLMTKAKSYDEASRSMEKFFSVPQAMTARTNLRQ